MTPSCFSVCPPCPIPSRVTCLSLYESLSMNQKVSKISIHISYSSKFHYALTRSITRIDPAAAWVCQNTKRRLYSQKMMFRESAPAHIKGAGRGESLDGQWMLSNYFCFVLFCICTVWNMMLPANIVCIEHISMTVLSWAKFQRRIRRLKCDSISTDLPLDHMAMIFLRR